MVAEVTSVSAKVSRLAMARSVKSSTPENESASAAARLLEGGGSSKGESRCVHSRHNSQSEFSHH